MKKNLSIIFIILFIFLYFIYHKIYANGYIGINMEPCLYCKIFPGSHFHYTSPTNLEWRENYRSDHHMCDLCKKYPGQYHFHNNFF